MDISFLDLLIAFAAGLSALAVAAVCGIGFMVWYAGGRPDAD
jgi:nitrate reductase NapE component